MAESTHAASGLALYRKYRPATFAEVRGQDHVTVPLRQALKSGRINHAYLFSGPRGCGKTSSARILARSLNCVNGPTPDPCGVCDSCVALAPSGPGSIDVIEIDAASHGGVDDARDLRERAFYAPVSGRFKIYIIDEAHMVTSQGFNALLKLVEEPPPHLKFVFATTEPEKVIPTIRSRTHHYPFRLVPPSVMRELGEEILGREGVPFDPAVLPLVVRAGAGSVRDTLSILDQLLAGSDESGIRYDRAVALLGYTDASLLDEVVDAFAAPDGAAVFRAVNRVIEDGHEPRRFAMDMLDRFRDLIVLASVPDAIATGLLEVPPDRVEVMTAQAGTGLAALTRAAEIIASGLDQMRGATSPRLLLELMCAQVLLPGAAADERSVLARLERLEARAGSAAIDTERTRVPPGRLPPFSGPAAADGADRRSGQSSPGGTIPRGLPDEEANGSGRPADPGPGPAAGGHGARPASPSGPPAPAVSGGHPAPSTRAELHTRAGPSTAPGSPATPAPSAPSAPPSSAVLPASPDPRGAVTAESLRQGWEGVLAALRAKSKVAWMLLGNSTVVSLDESVLTLRFPRPGDVKGFTSSKHEGLLKEVLSTRFGISVVVRAISGGDAPPGERRRGNPGDGGPGGSGYGGSGYGGPGSGESPGPSPAVSGPVPPDPGDPGAAADLPGGGPATTGYAGGEMAPREVGNGNSPAADSVTRKDNQGAFGKKMGGSTGGDSHPYALDVGELEGSVSASAELTGIGLIQRDLGGQIIGEFEE